MKTVFGSILFDEKKEMMISFFDSLNKQTNQDFDILLINDNAPLDNIKQIINTFDNIKDKITIIDSEENKRYSNRIQLIKESKQRGYDLLIRGDFDDTWSINRVDNYIKSYDTNYGFFYNGIVNESYNSVFKDFPKYINDYKEIGQYNFIGESSAGINLNNISYEFIDSLYKGKTIVFDWYLFTRMLLNNIPGKYIDDAYTIYRIWENTAAGIPSLTEKEISKELEYKRIHYDLLKDENAYYYDLYTKYNDSNNIKYNHLDSYYWWNLTYVD